MAQTTQLELVTPARVMVSKPVEMVVIPGSEGFFGVLAHHAPVLANLQRGVVEVYKGGKVIDRIMIDGGVADVLRICLASIVTSSCRAKVIATGGDDAGVLCAYACLRS